MKQGIPATLPALHTWPRWMIVAAAEIGVRERPGAPDEPRIKDYQRATRLREEQLGDETEWCASFVSWCLQEAGLENPRYAMARNFVHYGDAVTVPEFGDILVFSRGKGGVSGHVGFYVRDLGADFEVLGGNQGNSVRFSHESKADLLGVRRPQLL